MPTIAADSGFLYALFDAGDKDHAHATALLDEPSDVFVTNMPVLAEVSHLLRKSPQTQRAFLAFCQDALQLDTAIPIDLPRILQIMAKYEDLPADLADASLVAMCERLGIVRTATLDRDYDVYRLNDRTPFINVLRAAA